MDPKFFLINFDLWNVEIQVRMRKLGQFFELTPNQRTKWKQCAQNQSRQQGFDGNSEDKCNKLDGVDQGLMDIKETQQDSKVFMDYDEKQREKHKLDSKRSKTSNQSLTQGTNSTTRHKDEIAQHNEAIGQGICGGVYFLAFCRLQVMQKQ